MRIADIKFGNNDKHHQKSEELIKANSRWIRLFINDCNQNQID